MRAFLSILLGGAVIIAPLAVVAGKDSSPSIKGYYTRLPFDDHGMTGKYADIIVELPQRGQFVFSREFGYQPQWLPNGGKQKSVPRLIPRKGDGPDERPDNHNIACNAAIVAQTDTSVTVQWRYAPDLTKLSFTDFRAAYNEVGNPAPFYADYADEYFTIHADGKVERVVKNGCERLADWNDPRNQIEQALQLSSDGLLELAPQPATRSSAKDQPITGAPVKTGRSNNLVGHWRFDEGAGHMATEQESGQACDIGGAAAYWRTGVSGACLSFDSYSTVVTTPAARVPQRKDEFTVSAWIAIQEYPFNLAAIVDHMNGNNGYLLGVNANGQIEFKIGDGSLVHSAISQRIPLYEWIHVAAIAKQGADAVVYLNGEPVATVTNVSAFVDASNTDLNIGMTRSLRQFPIFAERPVTKQFKTDVAFSGLIDEVKLFDKALRESEVNAEHAAFKPSGESPLKPWVLPAGPVTSPGFRAEYTKLSYSPEWDGLWRVGDFSDIVVTFADKPWRYVFWRGTRYLPSLVTSYGRDGIWSNDQGAERYDNKEKQCYEHMSDMLCRFSNARIIHRSDARVVVHWRNASASIDYRWPALDTNGWGIWSDEYWTIYPDGISIRHQMVHNNTDKPITAELNQNEILCHPGQATEDVMNDNGIIIANKDGATLTINRTNAPTKKRRGDGNLQLVNLKGATKQFQIGEIGAWSQTFLHNDIFWRGWNHYPVQVTPSDGTRVKTYDRPSSTCPATFHELRHTNGNNIEAMVMYGLTDKPIADLTALNRSWNFAPEVSDTSGCVYRGYEKRERAFKFTRANEALTFTLRASKEQPLENPAFVIANWGSNDSHVSLKVNRQTKSHGADYRAAVEVGTDGTYSLVIWMPLAATKTTTFEITKEN
jgi:Concanavalin A-like lectin/glucanases superfamily